MKWPMVLGMMVASVVGAGCTHSESGGTQSYFGPTESMKDVAAAINKRADEIPSLWASSYFEADLVDPKTKKSQFVNADGHLLMLKPRDLSFTGTKEGFGNVLEIGSNADRYWLTVDTPDQSTQWWGFYRNLGKAGVESLPIPPDAILEVLGVSEIDTDFNSPPVPVMRFASDLDVYMFVWSAPAGTHWYATKEIWYDRSTKLPVQVMLFDENGRVVVRAKLSKYEKVEVPKESEGDWPQVATDYQLFFPDTQSHVHIELSEMATTKYDRPAKGQIVFHRADGAQVIQVDEGADDKGGSN